MIGFWIAAAALAAASGVLILARAAGAASASADTEDPAVHLYQRQLAELDDLAARGLLAPPDRQAAFAEAGRRLLGARARPAAPPAPASAGVRRLVAAAAAAAALLAMGIYAAIGAPGAPDAPFAARLAAWRRADPQSLDPSQMAAVLDAMAVERPRDAQLQTYLGRARLAAGDLFGAQQAFGRAAALAPNDPEILRLLGQSQVAAAEGAVTPDAEAVFRRLVRLVPAEPVGRFYLAKADIDQGRTAQGLAVWTAIRDSLAKDDPRRADLDARIAEVGAPPAAAPPPMFIQQMVERQAARLKAQPDDPAGWARLIRSYGVLGRADDQARARAEARRRFAGRPDALAIVNAE